MNTDTVAAHVAKAVRYIEENLDAPLDLAAVAAAAGYSPYHFSRLFKQHTGESIGRCIKRLRLEHGARMLITPHKPVTDVALQSGYATPSAFNKAFKARFACNPGDFRDGLFLRFNHYKGAVMNTPSIISREDTRVICCRKTGEYDAGSTEAWRELSEKLNDYARNTRQCLDYTGEEMLGICYDDPEVTEEEKIRYDACISSPELDDLPEGIAMQTIAGGKYVKVLHKGPHNELYDIWMKLYGWVQENGLALRDEPPFEKYLNKPEEMGKIPESEYLTEIYIPVE